MHANARECTRMHANEKAIFFTPSESFKFTTEGTEAPVKRRDRGIIPLLFFIRLNSQFPFLFFFIRVHSRAFAVPSLLAGKGERSYKNKKDFRETGSPGVSTFPFAVNWRIVREKIPVLRIKTRKRPYGMQKGAKS